MIGKGVYDDACTKVRQETKATGGVILLVLGGEHGSGFSAQVTMPLILTIPEMLRAMAAEIEKEMQRADAN